MADPDNRLETREVSVDEPGLSAQTNAALTREAREAVGRDRVQVPRDRPRPSRGEHGRSGPSRLNRFLLAQLAGSGIVFAAILALLTRDWLVLPLVVLVLAVVTATVSLIVVRMTNQAEHPSPSTAAALQEEGIHDPDEHFSEIVAEFTPEPEEGRQTSVEDDPAQASAEQRRSTTPSGGPSRPAGPGDGS